MIHQRDYFNCRFGARKVAMRLKRDANFARHPFRYLTQRLADVIARLCSSCTRLDLVRKHAD